MTFSWSNHSASGGRKKGLREVYEPGSTTAPLATQLLEYGWPADDPNADLWMVQEQVSNPLGPTKTQ